MRMVVVADDDNGCCVEHTLTPSKCNFVLATATYENI
jgi:hypothetical protein